MIHAEGVDDVRVIFTQVFCEAGADGAAFCGGFFFTVFCSQFSVSPLSKMSSCIL
jgi:hypothetical protein